MITAFFILVAFILGFIAGGFLIYWGICDDIESGKVLDVGNDRYVAKRVQGRK